MRARVRLLRWLPRFLVVALSALMLSACKTGDPFDTFTSGSNMVDTINNLFWPVFLIAVVIFFLVEGLLLFTIIRFRAKPGDSGLVKQTHGNTRLEVTWTIIPSLIMAGIAVPTVSTIVDLSRTPDNPVVVRVIGHQWWWEFRMMGPNGQEVITANQLHLPAGRNIVAEITSEDVIHSFWAPNIFGKQDAVPGRLAKLNFDVRDPGVYQGECAEFCLDSHALMRFLVIVEPEPQWNQWLAGQAAQARTPTTPSALRGREVLLGNACIGCHAISGTTAQGRTAPDLSHFGTRNTLGANRLENTPENVEQWIRNPAAFKPGAKMPAWAGQIPDEDIRAIVDYLHSLK